MKIVYLIGNAHLDVVWLWCWQEGFSEIKATFRSALDRMKEFDDFHFSCASAAYYEWIEQNEPEIFEEIKKYVAEGRWEIVGGMYVQPDCNIPCGESFVRHGLYSQRYFLDRFGVCAETGYNVDSFGHNGNLPQILRKCGMRQYVFMRPGPHEKDIPKDLFIWESQDGSQVLGYRIPFSYTTRADDEAHILKVFQLSEKENMNLMAFYGVGNHGGGATIQAINSIHEMEQFKNGNLTFSTTKAYFDAVRGLDLPVVRDDLQYHGKGCYTAYTEIKKNNRQSEHMMLTAEKICTFTHRILHDTYPMERLHRGWKDILFNQFHDVLGGCCIKKAFEDARLFHGEAMSIASRETNFAVQRISWRIDTLGGRPSVAVKGGVNATIWMQEDVGTPVVLFNPLSKAVKVPVQLRAAVFGLRDWEGRPVAFQPVRSPRTSDKDQTDSLFIAEIPALGYTVYHMFLDSHVNTAQQDAVRCTDISMENGQVAVYFAPQEGVIKLFYDKVNKRTICSNSCIGVLMDETNADTWGHDVRERIEYKTCFKRFDIEVGRFSTTQLKMIECGPVRATMRVISTFGDSKMIQDISLCAGEDKLRVRTQLDFHEKHKMLKLRFDSELERPRALCEIPYGYKEIPLDSSEEACHSWMASIQDGHGLAIINDSKYGCDANASMLDLTIIRGAIYADHWGKRDEFCEYMDQGQHEFQYVIAPFHSIEACTQEGLELNSKPIQVTETFHSGCFPQHYSGCTVEKDNVVISAIKRSEDNDGYVIRAYECAGQNTNCLISIPQLNVTKVFSFGHNEIKTIKVDDSGNVEETDMLERSRDDGKGRSNVQ